jgi:hypothetical protein
MSIEESISSLTDTTIYNKKYAFSISIPKSWKYSDNIDPNTMLATFSEEDSTSVLISCMENPKNYSDNFSLKEKNYIAETEKELSELEGQEWSLQKISVETIGGKKGYLINALVKNDIFYDGRLHKKVVINVIRPIGSFILIQRMPINTRSEMEKIINSIKFFD